MGGLLLGHSGGEAYPVVTVLDYKRVPCGHRRGPLYELDALDVKHFAEAVQAQQEAGDGLEIVGYFRSHMRPGLGLTPEELAFCKEQFGEPDRIVMLVRPKRFSGSTAGIFIWEDGEMRGEAPYLEFPCSRDELLPLCPEQESESVTTEDAPEERLGRVTAEDSIEAAKSGVQEDGVEKESTGREAVRTRRDRVTASRLCDTDYRHCLAKGSAVSGAHSDNRGGAVSRVRAGIGKPRKTRAGRPLLHLRRTPPVEPPRRGCLQ